MLFAFVGALGYGVLEVGRSVERERKLSADRLAEWKERAVREEQRADKAEQGLRDALPALASAIHELQLVREALRDARIAGPPG